MQGLVTVIAFRIELVDGNGGGLDVEGSQLLLIALNLLKKLINHLPIDLFNFNILLRRRIQFFHYGIREFLRITLGFLGNREHFTEVYLGVKGVEKPFLVEKARFSVVDFWL